MVNRKKGSANQSAAHCSDDSPDPSFDENWQKLETKLNEWVMSTLPSLVKEHMNKLIDEYFATDAFKQNIQDFIDFDSDEIRKEIQDTHQKIKIVQDANERILQQLDDLEQYPRRTNVRIYGIPESPDTENTDVLAIDFFKSELGVQESPGKRHKSFASSRKTTKQQTPADHREIH